jgi:hypothetical protein
MIEDLKRHFLFRSLGDDLLERVVRHAVSLRLAVGESLFEQGDRAERFFLLTRGQVKLFRLSPAGHEKVVDIIVPGGTFAEALMFLDRPHYPVGAQAVAGEGTMDFGQARAHVHRVEARFNVHGGNLDHDGTGGPPPIQ